MNTTQQPVNTTLSTSFREDTMTRTTTYSTNISIINAASNDSIWRDMQSDTIPGLPANYLCALIGAVGTIVLLGTIFAILALIIRKWKERQHNNEREDTFRGLPFPRVERLFFVINEGGEDDPNSTNEETVYDEINSDMDNNRGSEPLYITPT